MAGPPFDIDNTNPASSSLVSAFPPNEQANRTTIEEWLTFLSDPTTGIIKTSALPDTVPSIPAGTRMLFQQTAAPTGWTKITTYDNKALRIVSGDAGTGGTVDFTTAFASQAVTGTTDSTAGGGTVGDTTLTTAQIPSHTHGPGTLAGTTNTTGAHTHTLSNGFGVGSLIIASGGGFTYGTRQSGSAGNHSHTVSLNSGLTAATGDGGSHTHTFTGSGHTHTFTGTAINLAVAYVDIIIAERDA